MLLARDVGLESHRNVIAAHLVVFNDALLLCKMKVRPVRLKLVEFGPCTEITLQTGAEAWQLELVGRNKTWALRTDHNTRRELLRVLQNS